MEVSSVESWGTGWPTARESKTNIRRLKLGDVLVRIDRKSSTISAPAKPASELEVQWPSRNHGSMSARLASARSSFFLFVGVSALASAYVKTPNGSALISNSACSGSFTASHACKPRSSVAGRPSTPTNALTLPIGRPARTFSDNHHAASYSAMTRCA